MSIFENPQPITHNPQPIRTCIACRSKAAQNELIRIARDANGKLSVDARMRNGRSAYICRNGTCQQNALKVGRIARAIKENITAEEIESLRLAIGDLTS